MFFGSFDQFKLSPLVFGDQPALSISSLVAGWLVLFFVYALFMSLHVAGMSPIGMGSQVILEAVYGTMLGLVREQASVLGVRYFPLLFTVFIAIFAANIGGLLPFVLTLTSHLSVTLSFSFGLWLGFVTIGVVVFGDVFLDLFKAKKMPQWIRPLLIAVEVLSYTLRPFSLGIRLFANMLAGHILLHIVTGGAVFVQKETVIGSVLIALIIVGICFLESFVGFLQAYIFVVLSAIYLADSLVSSNH